MTSAFTKHRNAVTSVGLRVPVCQEDDRHISNLLQMSGGSRPDGGIPGCHQSSPVRRLFEVHKNWAVSMSESRNNTLKENNWDGRDYPSITLLPVCLLICEFSTEIQLPLCYTLWKDVENIYPPLALIYHIEVLFVLVLFLDFVHTHRWLAQLVNVRAGFKHRYFCLLPYVDWTEWFHVKEPLFPKRPNNIDGDI